MTTLHDNSALSHPSVYSHLCFHQQLPNSFPTDPDSHAHTLAHAYAGSHTQAGTGTPELSLENKPTGIDSPQQLPKGHPDKSNKNSDLQEKCRLVKKTYCYADWNKQ